MTAALALANQGFKVHLVEHSDHLGGHLHDIHYTLEKDNVSSMTKDLINQVVNHPNIDVYLGTKIEDISGHIGKFNTKLSKDGQNTEVTSGAVIVATGAEQG